MISVNEVTLVGNLTRDPELKALPSGSKVVSFSIATNRKWKDQNGQKQEEVEYHNIVAFGKVAETIAEYFSKGKQIYLKGRLKTRSWDGTDGKKAYRTEIILEEFQFGSSNDSSEKTTRTTRETSKDEYDGISYGEDDINPDDIPF